jgi:predicted RNase H-like HicB family nuclease
MAEATILHLTAAVIREGDWYVARCLEIEATSQGETVEQALDNLRDVVEVYLEEEPAPSAPTAALGHLIRRARPSVSRRLPRGVSGKQAVAVPLHRELATGTLAGILRRKG